MTISVLRTIVTGTSFLALCGGMAAAQQAEQGRETFLGTITISENAENPTAPMVGSVAHSAAATKTGTSILETQSSVSAINRTQMDRHAATTLAEALGYSAGVATENYGGDPRFDSVYLRGFNLENDKFLDGLRLMRSTQYPTSAPAFELYGLERVEILRGPTSVLYGSGSPAGIINMVQKRAQASGDFTEVGASMATNKGWSIFGDANRVVNDRFAYRITAKRGAQNTDVKEIGDQSTYIGLSSSYQLNDTTEIEVMASHQKDGPGSPTGVPYAMARGGDLDALRKTYFGDKSVDKSDRRMSTLSFGATHDFRNGWKGSATLRYTRFKWDYDNIYVSGGTPTVATRGLGKQNEKFTALAADIRLSGDVITGAADHHLTFGIDAQKLRENARTEFYNVRDFDITDPQYGGNLVGDQWYNANKTVKAHQVALYAIDEVRMGQWRGTFGLRHEWTRQTGQSLTNYGNTDYTRDNEATVGNIAIGYDWNEELTSYVSYATSYLPQPGVDIDNNPLKPTKGKQWELGTKYDPVAFDGLFTAALFELRETDRNTNVAQGGLSGIRQIGEARVRGLELEGAADLDDNWSLQGSYTYTKTKVTAGEHEGKQLKNVPEQMASVWLSYRFDQGVTLGGGVRYLGKRWGDDTNTMRLNAVTLVDLGASYEFENGVTARLNINNVMDKAYIAGVGSFADYIGDGRTVQAALTYKW